MLHARQPSGEPLRTLWLDGQDPQQWRHDLLAYFNQTFTQYEQLFDCLVGEAAWYRKAIPLRHPLIFYFGHTAAFFINKLVVGRFIDQRLDAQIESVVAIGVDEMSWDDLDDSHYAWPTVERLRAYRQAVRERVSALIEQMPLQLPIQQDSVAWAILMGIEHERIHLETSSVLIRQLPLAQVRPLADWPICPHARHARQQAPVNTLLAVDGGEVRLGKRSRELTYGWDNEYGQRQIALQPFSASRFLVSNAEFLTFVQAGGYCETRWWSEEGARWKAFANATMPTFWVGDLAAADDLRLRLMCQEVPMPWDWPVEVNQLEAEAFCRWKAAQTGLSIQLPCEAEWYRLRDSIREDQTDWKAAPGNINLEYWASSCPVDQFAQGDFYDVLGNVWQWTSTPIDGFDGFQVHPLYDDFSTPTFDGRHNLIKGGSWISTGNLALRASRYAFRRHFFQHAGFRYVASSYCEPEPMPAYETDLVVSRAVDADYKPAHVVQQVMAWIQPLIQQTGRALDMGCGTGRSSLELARVFEQVDGVDFSARFIDVAMTLVRQDRFRYALPVEGDLVEYHEARLSACLLDSAQTARVHFSQGDACNLKPVYQDYDLILALDLLDRLREPQRFLEDMITRLRPGGLLVVGCAGDWQTAFTPKENWLGGKRENGEALTTALALQRVVGAHLQSVAPTATLVIHQRLSAHCTQSSQVKVTFWRKPV